MAMTSSALFLILMIEVGKQNQVSNKTYDAGKPADFAWSIKSRITEVAFVWARRLLEYPEVLLSRDFASTILFFAFSEDKRQLLTGRNVLPSDQPRVRRRKPNLYDFFAWSYILDSSSTFLELCVQT